MDSLPARLSQLAALFLKLGTIAFGGPAAHIAMMEDEVVRRRKWLSREEFLDLLGATNLIPGPGRTSGFSEALFTSSLSDWRPRPVGPHHPGGESL